MEEIIEYVTDVEEEEEEENELTDEEIHHNNINNFEHNSQDVN